MSGESEEDTWEPLSHCTNSQLISPPDRQEWGLTCSVQWVCHAINKSPYICLFHPNESAYLGLHTYQNDLAYACFIKARLLWDDTVYVPTQSCQKYVPSPSLNTDCLLSYWYHARFSFSLICLHTLWCRLVGRNSVELNFVKTGLKSKFGVNPQFFSHELCLYITRFQSSDRV